MDPERLILLATAVANYTAVTWALVRGFVRPERIDVRMRLLGMVVTACGITTLTLLCLQQTPGPIAIAAAVTLWSMSTALIVWAIHTLRPAAPGLAFCGQRPRGLVTQGPYAWVRHPLYTSYMLSLAAGFAATGSWLLAPFAAVLCSAYVVAAREEDRILAAGELRGEFEAWRARTGAFLPKLWPSR